MSDTLRRWNDKLRDWRRSGSPRIEGDPRESFGAGALWTAVGTYVPGAGLIKGGRRMLAGTIACGLFVLTVLTLGVWALVDTNSLLHLAVSASFLKVLVLVLPLVTIGWLWLIVQTHLDLKPRRVLSTLQRGLATALVVALSFSVAAPMAVASRYAFDQSRWLSTIFRNSSDIRSGTAPEVDMSDPWKNKDRVNILLLGGDAGPDRYGLRTDTMLLASIDTQTGNTVLLQIPRNAANAPFPEDSPLAQYYPDGFTSGWPEDPEHMFNNIYDGVPQDVPADVLGPTDNLGADALKLAVGAATGQTVDYYALVDLAGFSKLIDALGGITVNINTWVAMGGDTDRGIPPSKWMHPGPNQHLNGTEALWFARGRYGADDFQRMDRQRCVIEAAINQANPANMLARYEDIARQSKDIIQTDIPSEILPAMVDLALRVKGSQRDSIVLRNGEDGFWSASPDWALVRARMNRAIEKQREPGNAGPAPADPTPATTDPGDPVDPADPGATPEVPATTEPTDIATEAPPPNAQPPTAPVAPPEDLAASCEFQPAVANAQPKQPPT